MNLFSSFTARFPGVVSIARNGALLTGMQWTEAILRGVYALLISRWLGPELYGAWSFATTAYVLLLAFTMFGLDTIIPLRLGRNRDEHTILGTTLLLRLALGVLATVFLAAYAGFAEENGLSRLALFLVLPAIIGRGLVFWARAVFLGLDQSKTAFRFAVALRIAEVTAGMASLALGAGLYVLLFIHSMAWAIEAVVSCITLTRRVSLPLRINGSDLRTLLREGFMLGIAASGLAILTTLPLLLTRYLIDDLSIVGYLGLATQLAALAIMVARGMLTAALPVVSRASSNGDARLRHYPVIVVICSILFFGAAMLLASALGHQVISGVWGEGFAPASDLLIPALLAGGLSVLPLGAWQVLVAKDIRWPEVFAGWTGAFLMLLALPEMVQVMGASGALYAASLGWALRAMILIFCALILTKASRNSP